MKNFEKVLHRLELSLKATIAGYVSLLIYDIYKRNNGMR